MTDESRSPFWFDTEALETTKPSALSAARRLARRDRDQPADRSAIAEFARANGFTFRDRVESDKANHRSYVLDGTCEDVVATDRAPWVEFGNHGWRYWLNDSGDAPSRRGYVALRHGLDLPTFYLDSASMGAATVRNALSVAVGAASALALDGEGGYTQSGLDAFKASSKTIRGLGAPNFKALAAKGDLDRVGQLVGGEALPLLMEVTKSFDVEVFGPWLFAHGYFGDLVTTDPDIWAWAFSTSSRLFEVLDIWGDSGIEGYRSLACWTPDWIDRPASLDGVLKSVLPGRDSKVGRFLFGRPPQ